MFNLKNLLYALLISCLLGSTAVAQSNGSQATAVAISATTKSGEILPLDPNVKIGTLPNGFKYYIRKNIEPAKRATFYLPMKAGSILENDDEQGLAHFLEHMAFNGTKNFPKNELINYLQTNGVRFGADLNAYTSFDETVYQLPIPTDNPEIIKNGLQILRDWAQDILNETDDINDERGVIIEEKRMGKGAQERMSNQYLPMLLNHSRYSNRLPIGTEEVLLNFKPETIREFYKKWYRPNLQALIVVGDIDVNEMEKLIIEKFSDMKNPANELERVKYTVPLSGKNQFMALTDKENTSTSLQVLMKHPGRDFKTTADYRDLLVKSLFNNLLGSRLGELRKQADPPFLSGSSSIGEFLAGVDVASVTVAVKPGQLERGFKAVWTETERVQKYGFTQTELDRMKNAILSYMESAYKERDKTHSDTYVKEYLALFLNDKAAPGIEYENKFYQDVLPKITLEEVNALAKQYYIDINRDILILAPEDQKANLPNEQTVDKWIADVAADELNAYEDMVSDQPLLAKEPVAGKIVKEKENKALGFKELTLSNGIKVILKPTDYKNDEIRFSSYSPGGNSLYSDADYQSAVNATGLITSSGLGEFNSIELPKMLSGKMVGVSPYISERYEGMNGSSSPKDLETAMQMITLYFTSPRVDKNIFEGLITNYKSSLSNRNDDPGSVFSDAASALLYNNNVRRTGPSIAKADEISLDRAFEIYKDRFADASDFTFFFVGNIDEATMRPLLEKYIASLPTLNRVEKGRDLGINIIPGKVRKEVRKGTEDKATVQLIFSGDYKYGAKENIVMDALGEVLMNKLLERLREVEGGVYTPGAKVSYGKSPKPKYTASISFGCSPENVDKLINASLDEIEKLQKNGATKEDLIKFVSEQQRGMETGMKTNGFWLNYISGQYQSDGKLDQVFKFDNLLKSITSNDIKKAASKYLTTKNFIELILLPEEGK